MFKQPGEHAIMKVLLKDEETRHYYGGEDRWVADASDAFNFEVIEKAGKKALECHARVTNVVLRYDDPICELALNPAYCLPAGGPRRSFAGG
jgi:hypothetical protein